MRKIAASVAAAAFCAIAVAGCNQGVKLDQMRQFDGAVFSIPSDWEVEEEDDSDILFIAGGDEDKVLILMQADPDQSLYEDPDEYMYAIRDSYGMNAEFEIKEKDDLTLVTYSAPCEDGGDYMGATVLEDNGGYAQMLSMGAVENEETALKLEAIFDTLEVV